MNFRKDIFERMTYIVKTETNRKPNYAKLARQFNCDYRTVKQYYEAASKGIKELPERRIPKKTDGFEQIIEDKLKTGAPAIAIYQYLREEKGFKGSYSTIKQFVHDYHRLQQQQAVIRFETMPGSQAQVDWKESLKFKTITGEEIKFNVFLLILGFSRFKFLMVTESRDRMLVEFCLACAFKKLGGVPHEILFDNMRSLLLSSSATTPRWTFTTEHCHARYTKTALRTICRGECHVLSEIGIRGGSGSDQVRIRGRS